VAERLREAAWAYSVSWTLPVPRFQLDWAMPSLAGSLDAVKLRVMWQVPPAARSLVVLEPEVVQSPDCSAKV
jgi:hypothetical protein